MLTVLTQSAVQLHAKRRGLNVCNDLCVLAKNCMAKLTMRTPERKPQCAQSPDIRLGSFNAAVDDPGGGWTMVDQHEAPNCLESGQASRSANRLRESRETQWYSQAIA